MGSSQSRRRGQAPSVCHLCKRDPNIKYKCFTCPLLMCKECCDNVHVKIKNSESHRVVDIKDIGRDINFTNIKCEDHSAFCCRFCKSCDQLVCPTCIAEGHKSHDLMEISEAYQQKLDKVKETVEINQKNLFFMERIFGHLEQFKSLQNDKIATEINKMEDYKQSLNKVMDIHIDKLISDLKSSKEEVLTAVNKDIETIKHAGRIVEAKHKKLIELKRTKDFNKFFRGISKMDKSKDNDIPQTPSTLMSIPRFVPKDINISVIGELQSDSDSASSCVKMKLKIIEQYQSEQAGITYTCSCTDGSLWIGDGIDRTVQRVRPDNDKLKVISTINTEVYGMASTESGDLLISTGGKRLQQISCKSGQISDTQYDVAPLHAIGIHITQEGKVIVGGYSKNLNRTAVFVLDTDGRLVRVYELDNHGQPLFNYPLRITSTSHGNIHVADRRPGHGRGRLVVLSQGGDIINIYSGHPSVNKVRPFYSADIATTPGDSVMVVDRETRYLHLLDNSGLLLTVYNTNDAGIKYPYSLAFTSSGSLWIGCKTRVDSTEKNAKLYHVTLSGY